MQAEAPSGKDVAIRAFLIADVRGYTSFTTERGDEAAAALADHFAAITDEALAACGGEVVELRGDEALAVFTSTRQALRAAVELQSRFASAMADDPSLPLPVGIGLDAGEAVPVRGGYRGAALNRAARLCSLAGPGEVLASDTAIQLAGRIEGLSYLNRGTAQLKGFSDPVLVHAVQTEPAGPVAGSTGETSEAGVAARQAPPIGGYLGALPAGILVARKQELRTALDNADAVQAGSGRLILLAGEAGVGKTRLAQEITLHLRDRGFLIAAGSCYEAHETSPYFPFLEAFASLYALAPESLRFQVPQRWPHLAALLPTASLPTAPAPSGSQGSSDALLWSASGFISALSEQTPVALLLDDLHWATGSSLELLQHLARHTRSDRVFILATYRDVGVRHHPALERTLHELDRQGLVQCLALGRLPSDGVSALVAAALDRERISEEFVSLLYARTEGNPFFLQQVLRDLVERGDLYREDGRWQRKAIAEIQVPESIRSAVAQRARRMSEATQEILQQSSVLGESFLFDDLQQLAAMSEGDLERCLDEAHGAGLIATQDGETYVFDHALTRQSLYAELSPRRRRRLHLAAGEVLERLPDKKRRSRLAELAWHFVQGNEPAKALRYSLQAGDAAAAIYAHADAEQHYGAAAGLARELEDEAAEALALERLARVLGFTSRLTEQLEVAEEAAGIYRRLGDLEGEARAVALTGRTYFQLNRKREGIDRLEELRRRFAGRPASPAHFAVHENLVTLYWASGLQEAAQQASEHALEIACDLDDAGIMARAQGRRGLALEYVEGAEAAAEAANLEAIRLAQAVGDLDNLYLALNNTAAMYLARGEFGLRREYLERALEVARRMGNPVAVDRILSSLGADRYDRGDLAGWRVAVEERYLLARRTDLEALSSALVIPGCIAMSEGRAEEARVHFEQCVAAGRSSGNALLVTEARWWLARLDMLEGKLLDAHAWFEVWLREPNLNPQERASQLPELAALMLEMNAPALTQPVRVLLDEVLVSEAVRTGLRPRSVALALSGWLASREGRPEEAVQLMEEGLALAQRLEIRRFEGRILLWYGLMLAKDGKAEAAGERLTQAVELFRDIGYTMEQRRAERLLAQST